ncbi:MAG: aminotransferase class V-fold PLP-dependent enzyme [Aureispira sp.]|nr:aminotransferase class V-fold PLP-dependent enzyme [Aureispira sp.]
MQNRRKFLGSLIGIGSAMSLQGMAKEGLAQDIKDSILSLHQLNVEDAVKQEYLWKRVQRAYAKSSILNLNNGGVSPQPFVVQEAEARYKEIINEAPSYYMWRVYAKEREGIRRALARLAGCLTDEIAITRNTTESINTVMLGLDWKKGDEVILTRQDYSTVKIGWEQLAKRKKVKLIWVDLPLPIEDEDEIVKLYTEQFSKRTKAINITQIINWTGQILPVSAIRKICDAAREKGIFTIVDGAHALAQINFRVSDLGCDAFASSLHKWLCAPFGTGILYIKKDRIKDVWPQYPSKDPEGDNIRKFEHLGTVPLSAILAISQAIHFHNDIGIELKESRLRYLKDYWCNALKDKVQLHTSMKPEYACAIGLFSVEGVSTSKILEYLTKNRIHATNSTVVDLKGVRISPNVYTTIAELDRMLDVVKEVL